MPWLKRGLVFVPSGESGWINRDTQMPVAFVRDGVLRTYFSTRPNAGLSLPAFIDSDIDEPSRILNILQRPLLEPGAGAYRMGYARSADLQTWERNDTLCGDRCV